MQKRLEGGTLDINTVSYSKQPHGRTGWPILREGKITADAEKQKKIYSDRPTRGEASISSTFAA